MPRFVPSQFLYSRCILRTVCKSHTTANSWECYKPVDQRRWGYYVCPVLYRDAFLGRLEGDVKNGTFTVRKVWLERKLSGDEETAFRNALRRHADNCDATLVLDASLEHKEEKRTEAKVGLRRSRSADGLKVKRKKRTTKVCQLEFFAISS